MNGILLLIGCGSGLAHSVYSALSKSLLKNRIAEPFLLLFYISVFQALLTPGVWLWIAPACPAPGGWPPLVLAALTCAAAYIFLYLSLECGDVSSVMPILGSKVVFTSVLAVPMLGETYGWTTYLAVLLVAVSVGLLSYSPSPASRTSFPLKPITFMLASCLIFAFTDIYIKRSLAFLDAYSFMVYYNLIVGVLALAIVPFLKKKRVTLVLKKQDAIVCLLASVALVAATLLFVVMFNLAHGVVIPNILMSTRGLFIVLITAALTFTGSTHLEKQSFGVYAVRFVASLLIVASIWISLSK
jgi:drug/metabolite transporter (DMT)-like permease